MKPNRKIKGSLLAEFTANIWVLFFFLVLPLLDISVLAFRAFFLWFAANQAVSSACKAKTYLQPSEMTVNAIVNSATRRTTYPSACELAVSSANQVRSMLSGIHWEESDNNPDVQIVRQPINVRAKDAQPAQVFHRGHGAPLEAADAPDISANIYTCRVVIKGQVDPLITIPYFKIPGVSCPIDLTVSSQAKYENVPGLTM